MGWGVTDPKLDLRAHWYCAAHPAALEDPVCCYGFTVPVIGVGYEAKCEGKFVGVMFHRTPGPLCSDNGRQQWCNARGNSTTGGSEIGGEGAGRVWPGGLALLLPLICKDKPWTPALHRCAWGEHVAGGGFQKCRQGGDWWLKRRLGATFGPLQAHASPPPSTSDFPLFQPAILSACRFYRDSLLDCWISGI